MPMPSWVGRVVDRGTAKRVEEDLTRDYPLPEDLKGMDELALRWSQQAFEWKQPNANPIYWAMREREGAALPGGEPPPMDDDVLAFDRCVRNSHAAVFAFLKVWYCTGGSVDQKAKRIGLPNRGAMYKRRDVYLAELRGQLRAGYHIIV